MLKGCLKVQSALEKKNLTKKEKMLSKKERKKEESIISQIHYPTPFMIPGKQPGRSSFPPKVFFLGSFCRDRSPVLFTR